jgi:hypothetical protein
MVAPTALHVPIEQFMSWGDTESPEAQLLGSEGPQRAITAEWDVPLSKESIACVQPENDSLFILDPTNKKFWHLTLQSGELEAIEGAGVIVVVDPPNFKEGDDVTINNVPVRPDHEVMDLLAAMN